jgi:adenosylmethionine-8-amino-7-oxononanoate aminotransferase
MKDYEKFPPIQVAEAKGSIILTSDGKSIIDAISSWWCKSLGHAHPRISEAVRNQMERFEHVIMANTCNETLVELSERLAELAPPLRKTFYVDNGSTAVEVAMKMSLQYHAQTGHPEKNGFMALQNGYHGETILTLAAGDCDLYSSPYAPLTPEIAKIADIPRVTGPEDPKWLKMPEDDWLEIEKQLDAESETLSAILFEPILQGAGGMKLHSPDFLRRLAKWARGNNVHLIADEIMTGFGRTGKPLAVDHAGTTPDFICLSKGLTAGWGPMAAVLTSDLVYEAFYDDYFSGKAFMHSNTFCGHALSAAAALEAMKIYEEEDIFANVAERAPNLKRRMFDVAERTGALTNIRGVGFAVAADIVNPTTGEPFPKELRVGYECYRKAVELGALLRPLGDSIYFLPPLNTPDDILDELAEIAATALNAVMAERLNKSDASSSPPHSAI